MDPCSLPQPLKNGSTGFQPGSARAGCPGFRTFEPWTFDLGLFYTFLLSEPVAPIRIFFVPWLIPTWARAQTWWNVVLVRRGVGLTKRLLAHELAHVLQWRTLGVVGFVRQYARHLIRHGYLENPLEIVARQAEHDDFYLNWAQEILESRQISTDRQTCIR